MTTRTTRAVIVTGAAQGLGRAHAELLASRGAGLVVNDLRPVDDVVERIRDAGGAATGVPGSAADAAVAQSLVDAAIDTYGAVDAVVANAGPPAPGGLADTPFDDLRAAFDVHVGGSYHLVQAALPHFEAQHRGRVVLTTSSAGLVGNDFDGVAYAVAKAAVFGLLRAAAHATASSGVAVNAIAPYARTPTTEGHIDPRLAAWLDPSYVSPLVAWLVSDECAVTGQVFAATGGAVANHFVGVTRGARAEDPRDLTPERVGEWLDRIAALDDFVIPASTMEDFLVVFGRPEVTRDDGSSPPQPGE